MEEKYALVTGSSDRIGKAIALDLAHKGYNLILHYGQSKGKVEKVKEEILNIGRDAITLSINFLEDYDYDQLFAKFKEDQIQLEILVNCASDFQPSSFQDIGKELLEKELKINFESAYLLTKAFARTYEYGSIIYLIDTKVSKNYTKHLDYILSKKLLESYTRLSAVHLAPHFRVNGIAPGLVLPPKGKDEKYLLDLAKDIPLKTIGGLEDILKAFRFFIDSPFVTGQILYIDGGDFLI